LTPVSSEKEELDIGIKIGTSPSTDRCLLEILDQVRPALSTALIGGEGYVRLARIASLLPLKFSNFWGLEIRLGQPEALADILLSVHKGDPGMALLAGSSPSSLDPLCQTWPGWRTLRAFAGSLLNEGHQLHRRIRNLWLEFDLAEAAFGQDLEKAIAQPNLFFGPEMASSPEEMIAVISEVMAMHGSTQPGPGMLRWFLDALPPGAMLVQVGLMLTRVDDSGLRCCVTCRKPETIRPWLSSILPKDHSEPLFLLVKELLPLTHHTAFFLNLTEEGVEAAIGLECYRDWLQDGPEHWSALLDFLTDHGLCLPQKVKGIQDYAGVTESPLSDRLAGSMLYLPTSRKIHHLKCLLAGGRITQAKAYLSVSRPRIPRDIAEAVSEEPGMGPIW
jgi:hypothetical protein